MKSGGFDILFSEMIDEIEAEAHSFLHGNDEIASGQVSQLLQVGLKLAAEIFNNFFIFRVLFMFEHKEFRI